MRVYQIIGSRGEWEDYTEWVTGTFLDKEKAERHLEWYSKLNDRAMNRINICNKCFRDNNWWFDSEDSENPEKDSLRAKDIISSKCPISDIEVSSEDGEYSLDCKKGYLISNNTFNHDALYRIESFIVQV